MVADKGKKLKATDKNDEANAEQIDSELVLSIEKLQEIQDDLEKINEKASDEVLEVEKRYNEVRKPVYDKRNEIIKSIPDFWLTAFLSHPALSELVTEEDHKVFKHLTSIDVEDSKDVKSGYSITFNFSPNPYFEDTKLTKTFTFLDEGTTKVTATSIKWKEGMGIPNGVDNDKKGNKRAHIEERTLVALLLQLSGFLRLLLVEPLRVVDVVWGISLLSDVCVSKHLCDCVDGLKCNDRVLTCFFSWFSETQQTDDDIHDEVAEIIKEDLWPNPLTTELYVCMSLHTGYSAYFMNEKGYDDDECKNGVFFLAWRLLERRSSRVGDSSLAL
uniref:NAP1-related protein 2 n=1 Tax=Chenopodium quinoa TaxID=63459 RepID=A0A803L950_CHEQI